MSHSFNYLHRTNAVCAIGGQGESFPLWVFEGEALKKEVLCESYLRFWGISWVWVPLFQ